MSTKDIVSDAEITKVHANANFGTMSPRQVVDTGVMQTAFGFSVGSTTAAILREHKLARPRERASSYLLLSKKGTQYLRALVAYEDVCDLAGVPR